MTHMIPIERLATGNRIALPGYDSVEALECVFDGHGYMITYCTNDRYGWDTTDTVWIEVGSAVEYAGHGEPMLRQPDRAELEALFDANSEATNLMLADIARIHGETAEMQKSMGFALTPLPSLEAEAMEAAE